MVTAIDLGRRAFIGGAAALAGMAMSTGLARDRLDPAIFGLDQHACLERLFASLRDEQRSYVCLPADHPSRQIDNTGPVLRRPPIGELLSPAQRALVRRLFATTLSERGLVAYGSLLALEAAGLDACVLIIYGRPGDPGFHAMINGPHLLMRSGAVSGAGVAFNGPLAYGHQVGNGSYRLPGNAFAFQAERANALYLALETQHKQRARWARLPAELLVQVQDADGRFDGLSVAELSDSQKELASALLDTLLGNFDLGSQAAARSAIDHNGGLDALHVAFYEAHGYYPDMVRYAALGEAERSRRGEPYFQVFRVEGPGAVMHFRGYPHLHAYLQIARDPKRQHVGEVLAETSQLIEGDAVRALLYRALRERTGASAAYYGDEINSRFCPGPITTGLLFSLDPYENHVAVVAAKVAELGSDVKAALLAQGAISHGEKTIRIATIDYFARRTALMGKSARVDKDALTLRELLVEHVRRNGIAGA